MKKYIIILLLSTVFITKVNADELYSNKNGVTLTNEEYKMISDFYWEGYQENLSVDDYKFLKDNNFFENDIQTMQINDYDNLGIMPKAEHTTASKSLKMSKNCSSSCIVSISLIWLKVPKVKSYDIIGAYFDGTFLQSPKMVYVETDSGRVGYDITKKSTKGIGTSFKLPSNLTSLKVTQTIIVEKKGSINASYQHAKKSISFENSKKYTFSKNGFGGVFQFNNGIADYYDGMLGVRLNL